jgi:hypothetical protein
VGGAAIHIESMWTSYESIFISAASFFSSRHTLPGQLRPDFRENRADFVEKRADMDPEMPDSLLF